MELNTQGKGTGYVNVAQFYPNKEGQPNYYRLDVMEFIMPDGTTVAASYQGNVEVGEIENTVYKASNGAYTGTVSIEGGGRVPDFPVLTVPV